MHTGQELRSVVRLAYDRGIRQGALRECASVDNNAMHRNREAGHFQMDNHSSRPGDCGRYPTRRSMTCSDAITQVMSLIFKET
jgi:hypothetical protein